MNRENILAVRDAIEAAPDAAFRMSFWDCGTSACIGGWCDRLFNDGEERHWFAAANDLGIDYDTAERLFFGFLLPRGETVTRPMALQALTDIANGKSFASWSDYA